MFDKENWGNPKEICQYPQWWPTKGECPKGQKQCKQFDPTLSLAPNYRNLQIKLSKYISTNLMPTNCCDHCCGEKEAIRISPKHFISAAGFIQQMSLIGKLIAAGRKCARNKLKKFEIFPMKLCKLLQIFRTTAQPLLVPHEELFSTIEK